MLTNNNKNNNNNQTLPNLRFKSDGAHSHSVGLKIVTRMCLIHFSNKSHLAKARDRDGIMNGSLVTYKILDNNNGKGNKRIAPNLCENFEYVANAHNWHFVRKCVCVCARSPVPKKKTIYSLSICTEISLFAPQFLCSIDDFPVANV